MYIVPCNYFVKHIIFTHKNKKSFTLLLFVECNSIAMQHYPSEYDTLHAEKKLFSYWLPY